MRSRALHSLFRLLVLLAATAALGQPKSNTLVILPFENASSAPGLEWIGEAFPEVLGPRMASGKSGGQ